MVGVYGRVRSSAGFVCCTLLREGTPRGADLADVNVVPNGGVVGKSLGDVAGGKVDAVTETTKREALSCICPDGGKEDSRPEGEVVVVGEDDLGKERKKQFAVSAMVDQLATRLSLWIGKLPRAIVTPIQNGIGLVPDPSNRHQHHL